MRFLTVSFLVLLSSSISKSAEPTIDWDAGSPAATPGPRFQASGTYTVPPAAGNPIVSYMITRIAVDYRIAGGSWSSINAKLDTTAKTWTYTPVTPLPAGVYEISARFEVEKLTTVPPAVFPSSESKVYYPTVNPKNVTLPPAPPPA